MNRGNKLIYHVAKWEFNRWFKIKDQIITLVIGAVLSLLIFGGNYLVDTFSNADVNISIINETPISLEFNDESNILIKHIGKDELGAELQLLKEKEIDGILFIKDLSNIELTVKNDPLWLITLQETLNSSIQKIKLEQSNISVRQIEEIFSPTKIKLLYTGDIKEKTTLQEKITAGVFIAVMFLGVFIGLAYQFAAITGEKQLRITEVIVSAISSQTWIDGKILGLSLFSLALLVTYSLSSIIFVIISSLFGSGWSLPISLTNPILIINLLLFSISGFFFWNTFFSAIAATISDPNTSARGSFIMLPIIPVIIAFLALGNPDSLAMKIFSIIPLTSAPVISARLVLTDVHFTEIVFSLLFLAISIWYLRKAAGKIFALSMLMYGKEPSWKEIKKWFKESHN